jgi:HAD superfamily hydrolase (TIGR01509 family)
VTRAYDGVIFDMDGTLIESNIDFAGIRIALGIPEEEGILEWIDARPDDEGRRHAHRYLLERELAAVRGARLMPGADRLCRAVEQSDLRSALLTRNAGEAMSLALERFPDLRFDLCWSREQGPIKPEPDGVLRACRRLGIAPQRALCVGDFYYDLVAAESAGADFALLATGEKAPDWAGRACYVLARLDELIEILGLGETRPADRRPDRTTES